jgi:hypothetical protein
MTPSVPRETFVQATRDLPEVRITEVVLQTARWQEMKDWYSAFLGVEPFFETETLCFRRVSSAHNQLFVLIPTTSLSCLDQICPRRIAVLRSQVQREDGLLHPHKSLR